jgi:flagellin
MSLNSIDTNMGAMVALQTLNQTNSALQTTQKQISTGLRVADATDDGAAYAVAQRVRSDVGALTSANQQLGNVQGLLSTTISGLNNVSNEMNTMRDVLTNLASGGTSGSQRSQYIAQYTSDLANVKSYFQDAGYNGKTLIGNMTGSNGTFSGVSVVRNELGATYGIASFGGSAFLSSITFTATQLASATSMQAAISASGVFLNKINQVGTQLNTYGAANTYINNQITYNSDKIDSLNAGLGSMIDADMAKESAQLQALADPPAAWHPGAVHRQPGAELTAQPVQVSAAGG